MKFLQIWWYTRKFNNLCVYLAEQKGEYNALKYAADRSTIYGWYAYDLASLSSTIAGIETQIAITKAKLEQLTDCKIHKPEV